MSYRATPDTGPSGAAPDQPPVFPTGEQTRRERAASAWDQFEPVVAPTAILAAGLGLALLDLVSPEAPGLLRVPALLAALLLTTDAITQLEALFSSKPAPEEPITPPVGPGTAVADPRSVGRAYEPPPPAPEEDRTARRRRGSSPGALAYWVLILAVWLGLASLGTTTATNTLRLLSLLAAVMIFKRGWDVVGPRRTA
jgi:hypothetical protein